MIFVRARSVVDSLGITATPKYRDTKLSLARVMVPGEERSSTVVEGVTEVGEGQMRQGVLGRLCLPVRLKRGDNKKSMPYMPYINWTTHVV